MTLKVFHPSQAVCGILRVAENHRFIGEFHKDMEALGCLPPNQEPKATDHVSDMVSTIEQIISNGHGYAVDGDVFFDVASLPGYGRLSGRAQVIWLVPLVIWLVFVLLWLVALVIWLVPYVAEQAYTSFQTACLRCTLLSSLSVFDSENCCKCNKQQTDRVDQPKMKTIVCRESSTRIICMHEYLTRSCLCSSLQSTHACVQSSMFLFSSLACPIISLSACFFLSFFVYFDGFAFEHSLQ